MGQNVQLAVTFPIRYLQYKPPGWQNMSEIHNQISRLSGRPTVYVYGPKDIRGILFKHN